MNISNFVEPYILFLKGVSLNDIISIEDIFSKEIIEADTETDTEFSKKEEMLWDKIPSVFTTLDNWNKQTNIRCWFCTLRFKSVPWFIIKSINQTASGKIYNIDGNFCSCGCLMGFVKKTYSRREHFDIYHNIYSLYTIMTNKKKLNIIESPDIFNLKFYGGGMSIEKYREELEKINYINMH
jgi:hypothetical protein